MCIFTVSFWRLHSSQTLSHWIGACLQNGRCYFPNNNINGKKESDQFKKCWISSISGGLNVFTDSNPAHFSSFHRDFCLYEYCFASQANNRKTKIMAKGSDDIAYVWKGSMYWCDSAYVRYLFWRIKKRGNEAQKTHDVGNQPQSCALCLMSFFSVSFSLQSYERTTVVVETLKVGRQTWNCLLSCLTISIRYAETGSCFMGLRMIFHTHTHTPEWCEWKNTDRNVWSGFFCSHFHLAHLQ